MIHCISLAVQGRLFLCLRLTTKMGASAGLSLLLHRLGRYWIRDWSPSEGAQSHVIPSEEMLTLLDFIRNKIYFSKFLNFSYRMVPTHIPDSPKRLDTQCDT